MSAAPFQIQSLRSYRATLVPAGTAVDEIEYRSDQGALPTLRIKAGNASQAEQAAHYLSGLPILKVERIEVGA